MNRVNMNNKQKIVVQHNQLLQSTYRMGLTEQRILRTCVSSIQRNKTNSRKFIIDVNDYNKIFGTNEGSKSLKLAASKLMQRSVTIDEPIEIDGRIWKDGGFFNFVSSAFFNGTEMKITLTEEIMAFLENMAGNHTNYVLNDIAQLKSQYSIRFYELFKQHLDLGTRRLEVAEIRKMFNLDEKYKKTGDFRRRIIEGAIDDINKNSPMNVSFKAKKRGRSIVAYEFTFTMIRTQARKSKKDEWINKVSTEIAQALKDGKEVTMGNTKIVSYENGYVCDEDNNCVLMYNQLINNNEYEIKDTKKAQDE